MDLENFDRGYEAVQVLDLTKVTRRSDTSFGTVRDERETKDERDREVAWV